MWRFLGFLLIALGVTGVILWGAGYMPFLEGDQGDKARTNPSDSGTPNRNVVETVIKPGTVAPPSDILLAPTARPDAVTIPDTVLSAENETEIASRLDGKIEEMNVKLDQWVKPDQVLIKLDDRVALRALARQDMKFKSGAHKIASAVAFRKYYSTEVDRIRKLGSAATDVEKQSTEARLKQAEAELLTAEAEKVIDELELERMKEELQFHYIKSNREGRIDKIYNNRKAGEVVKAGEPLCKVVTDDVLRAEGAIDAHLARYLKVGMTALVEPERQLPPFRTLRVHTGAVTDLAVTPDGRLLASASKDGTVIVWNWVNREQLALLPNGSEEVYAVACGGVTNPDAQQQRTYTFATGCSRGRAFFWRVTVDKNGKRVGDPKSEELKDRSGPVAKNPHGTQPVRAVAFSPDGTLCATGGDDYQVCLWKVESGELLCLVRETSAASDRAHRGAVTSLAFTKDGQLISIGSTDKAIKKWKIGQSADGKWTSELAKEKKDRAAQVTRLGLTADGGRILFDYGDELRILDTADDWKPLGALRNPRPGHFQNIAIFSPGGQMALAVSAGRLQLWALREPKAGSEDRSLSGYESRQLMTTDPTKITCGAFYLPRELGDRSKGAQVAYAFTGGEDGTVQAWELPPEEERNQPLQAKITYVSPQIERGGTGLIQVRATIDKNPTDSRHLKVGQRVNLVVFPEGGEK
jgi:WD40 repeat protein/multidrug efflux pump subunit AcrA (membrane-fusion protein)